MSGLIIIIESPLCSRKSRLGNSSESDQVSGQDIALHLSIDIKKQNCGIIKSYLSYWLSKGQTRQKNCFKIVIHVSLCTRQDLKSNHNFYSTFFQWMTRKYFFFALWSPPLPCKALVQMGTKIAATFAGYAHTCLSFFKNIFFLYKTKPRILNLLKMIGLQCTTKCFSRNLLT